ncbi:MAG: glycoside hydrolase family 2 protein [Firmicutes bacterium]|nr:glycoside hydrolase family 2 protein [Bacillota bacterium]
MGFLRNIIPIDNNWRFNLGDVAGAENPCFDDSTWRKLDLPHDWQIEQPFDAETPSGSSQGYMPRWHVGWYRLKLHVPQEWDGKIVRILFEGIQRCASCWINGHLLGTRPYGYASYFYDLTPYLNFGEENVIAVKVDNSEPVACRWYSGAGIYRHVSLIITPKLHMIPWGVHISSTVLESKTAKVHIEAKIFNAGMSSVNGTAKFLIKAPSGCVVACEKTQFSVESNSHTVVNLDILIENAILWDIDSPNLYTLQAILVKDEKEIDLTEEKFGIRYFKFDGDTGFWLNGRNLKLKGVNLHHDCGCVGAAVPSPAMWERRLKTLKELGCNAIRTSHNPPAPELLNLCDKLGFLVIDEAFDKWHWKSGYYYKFFEEWWKQDIDSMMDRDYNHPCVIVWSVGNEVNRCEDPTEQITLRTMEMLVNYARKKDPSRPISCALMPYAIPGSSGEYTREQMVKYVMEFLKLVDVAMLNYQEEWYDDYRKLGLRKAIIGSEIVPYYRSTGETGERYMARPAWLDVEDRPWVAGGFIWAGIDYLGEARPFPSKGWAACPIDTCGIIKPRGYHLKSLWVGNDNPFIYVCVMDETVRHDMEPVFWGFPKLADHWNFDGREGDMMRVAAFTNCDKVRMYLNGKYFGEVSPKETADRIAMFFIPYEPGILKAECYVNGKMAAICELRTAGSPAKIQLDIDKQELRADGHDVIHAVVALLDKEGNKVPFAEPMAKFLVTGPAFIAGVDNGDLTSNESYKGNSRRIFRGRCMAVIQSGHKPGIAVLTVQVDNLPPVSRWITVK